MSTAGCMRMHCPECDVLVPIDLILKPPRHEDDAVIVVIEPDLTDVMAHAWTHEAGEPVD